MSQQLAQLIFIDFFGQVIITQLYFKPCTDDIIDYVGRKNASHDIFIGEYSTRDFVGNDAMQLTKVVPQYLVRFCLCLFANKRFIGKRDKETAKTCAGQGIPG